jgi:hypothetical protein
MHVHSLVRELFSRFENLNLLTLREDLRRGLAARGDWLSSGMLCPLAHGLSNGEVVRHLRCVSQAVHLEEACRVAGEQLGAPAEAVYRFVNLWDDSERHSAEWLQGQLDVLWLERLEDAECVQAVLEGGPVLSHPLGPNAKQ